MDGDQDTFWMVPRAVLDLVSTPWTHQRALITYNILFSGPLIISDSDYINNVALRLAIRENEPFAKELFERGLIRLALRTINGNPVPLGRISETISQRAGGLLEGIAPGDAPELKWLENTTYFLPYDLKAAAPRYQTEVLRLLDARSIRDFISDDVALAIAETSRQIIASGGSLSWSLYSPKSELWEAVHTRLGDSSLRDRFGEKVFEIARGPYSTFLPSALGVGATYSSEDQIGIDLWRGRRELSEQELDRQTVRVNATDLTDMVAGLSRLTPADIVRLRSSAARMAYEEACKNYDPTSSTLDNVIRALLAYREEINDAVAATLPHRLSTQMEELTLVSSESAPIAISEQISHGVYEEYNHFLAFTCRTGLSALGNALTFGQFGALQFAYSRIQARFGREVSGKAPADQIRRHDKNVEQKMKLADLLREDSKIVTGRSYLDSPKRDLFATIVARNY